MKFTRWSFLGVIVISSGLITGGMTMVSAQPCSPVLQVGMSMAPPPLAFTPGPGPVAAPGPAPIVPGEPIPGAGPSAPGTAMGPPLGPAGPNTAPPVPPLPTGRNTLTGPQGVPPAPAPVNARRAVITARAAGKLLRPGRVWIESGPEGEEVARAAITYQGVAVGALEFDPVNGVILPCGYHPRIFNTAAPASEIVQELPGIIRNLKVLDGAEYLGPENIWVVPLAYNGRIVAHMKVYRDGIHVIPDYPVTREMQVNGQ